LKRNCNELKTEIILKPLIHWTDSFKILDIIISLPVAFDDCYFLISVHQICSVSRTFTKSKILN